MQGEVQSLLLSIVCVGSHDPPWSCDPTVQSIWLAVSKEVEEKGMANSKKIKIK